MNNRLNKKIFIIGTLLLLIASFLVGKNVCYSLFQQRQLLVEEKVNLLEEVSRYEQVTYNLEVLREEYSRLQSEQREKKVERDYLAQPLNIHELYGYIQKLAQSLEIEVLRFSPRSQVGIIGVKINLSAEFLNLIVFIEEIEKIDRNLEFSKLNINSDSTGVLTVDLAFEYRGGR